ncbi:MAG TPA: hypothetical protein DCZ92_07040 [Elusimicrobia bacterium]|nr:MAG: hypothetical protein A2016_04925 [Elusimicrobia bacterium GWF2_62_30]HBA60561.1 hypothetical protein [Elusimicrobiota bacterium]
MKKYIPVICFAITALAGTVSARADGGALVAVLSMTDSAAQSRAAGLPVPSLERVGQAQLRLIDITEKCLRDGEVVSAFPAIYTLVHNEENARVIKVFSFVDMKGLERRVEVYYTGGDWMQYGLVYVATNAGGARDRARAYFVQELSTTDREEGAVEPRVDPFDNAGLMKFLAAEFLEASGGVKAGFVSLAEAPASAD